MGLDTEPRTVIHAAMLASTAINDLGPAGDRRLIFLTEWCFASGRDRGSRPRDVGTTSKDHRKNVVQGVRTDGHTKPAQDEKQRKKRPRHKAKTKAEPGKMIARRLQVIAHDPQIEMIVGERKYDARENYSQRPTDARRRAGESK